MLDKNLPPKVVTPMFNEIGEPIPMRGLSIREILRRSTVTKKVFSKYFDFFNSYSADVVEQIFTEVKYEGYLARAEKAREDLKKMENKSLSPDIDYSQIKGLRLEAIEKLQKIKPLTVGQAGRISGVSPADVNVLIMALGIK